MMSEADKSRKSDVYESAPRQRRIFAHGAAQGREVILDLRTLVIA